MGKDVCFYAILQFQKLAFYEKFYLLKNYPENIFEFFFFFWVFLTRRVDRCVSFSDLSRFRKGAGSGWPKIRRKAKVRAGRLKPSRCDVRCRLLHWKKPCLYNNTRKGERPCLVGNTWLPLTYEQWDQSHCRLQIVDREIL